jgi:hypothetical protein
VTGQERPESIKVNREMIDAMRRITSQPPEKWSADDCVRAVGFIVQTLAPAYEGLSEEDQDAAVLLRASALRELLDRAHDLGVPFRPREEWQSSFGAIAAKYIPRIRPRR